MTAVARSPRASPPVPSGAAGPTPCDVMLARRRRTRLRDWLLALAALTAAAAAGLFHGTSAPGAHAAAETSASWR